MKPVGTIVGVRILSDEMWDSLKEGKVSMFSIGGEASWNGVHPNWGSPVMDWWTFWLDVIVQAHSEGYASADRACRMEQLFADGKLYGVESVEARSLAAIFSEMVAPFTETFQMPAPPRRPSARSVDQAFDRYVRTFDAQALSDLGPDKAFQAGWKAARAKPRPVCSLCHKAPSKGRPLRSLGLAVRCLACWQRTNPTLFPSDKKSAR